MSLNTLLSLGEKHDSHHELKTHSFVTEVSQNIQNLIKNSSVVSDISELQYKLTHLEATANIADVLFNGVIEKMDLNRVSLYNDFIDNREDIDVYNHTPIVAIYLGSKLIFANNNYITALNYESITELIDDLKNGVALEKYIPESQQMAKQGVEKLEKGEGFEDLLLITTDGKKLYWTSRGKLDGIQQRIGIDKTNGEFVTEAVSQKYEGYNLNTHELIESIIRRSNAVIGASIKTELRVLQEVLPFVDRIWNKSDLYMMNAFITHNGNTEILGNSKYATNIGRPFKEIQEKHKNGTLFADHYDFNTQLLIKAKFEELKKNGYFTAKFETIHSSGIEIPNNWFRHEVVTHQSKTTQTGFPDSVGIGTSVQSDTDVFLKKWS